MAGPMEMLFRPNGLGVDAISGGQPVSEWHTGLDTPYHVSGPTPGMETSGNIDLANRPHIRNKDGSYSTVYSGTFGADGKQVLLPLVAPDHMMNDKEAFQRYLDTGEHLGIFDNNKNADAYAERLHMQQALDGTPAARLAPLFHMFGGHR